MTTPWYSSEFCADELLNFGSSDMPTPAAACAHCILRCLVGTTTVIRSTTPSASNSPAIRRANAVLPAPGVATARKSRGRAARYRTKARRCQPRNARVLGARVHNLRGVDVAAPRDALVAFTGISGSGKSSLAFGTIFAEAQRRYFESVAPYA